ncbi:stage III sporulation protein AF [Salsuginibacillus halophilus]|uniref:Stage III sporulation protein AF n=1 Tax=Salsuginibacillus halophilus TaxID=517424 RepID=A0A2P8HAG7_9BACI|nr:stage III sporulation protein AF [Salsuginibacillus halophilus]PSL43191.1 stage III sporulation protein AF [Salsuginibacillus halophilus]
MTYITEWIASLILFLLLAAIVELLLPATNLKRYAELAMSLILMLLLLQPVFDLINEPLEDKLPVIPAETEQLNEEIEAKKKEIQAGHDAYISEQMAVQLGQDVNDTLQAEFGLEVRDVDARRFESEGKLNVVLGASERDGPEEGITSVSIAVNEAHEGEQTEVDRQKEEVRMLLAEAWEMSEADLELVWEEEPS